MKNQIIDELLENLEKTEDFVFEQSPDIIQQIIKYEKIHSFLTASIMGMFIAGSLICSFYFWKNPSLDKWGGREFGSFLGLLIPLCLAPLFFVQLCYSIDNLIKIYISPKYFLISLISSMNK